VCNKSSENSQTVRVDTVAPSVTPGDITNSTWRNTDLSQAFTASDLTSGLATSADAGFTLTASLESATVSTPTTVSKTVSDVAGNSTTRTVSSLIDKTAPIVALVGGPANGGSYYFGSVPAVPTCSASDALSGLASACSVTGYLNTVGAQTVTASAEDAAGNTSSTTASYAVLAWTINGFYQPVDMGGVVNTVKAGSTVPLKFEVFAGPSGQNEQTAVTAIKSTTGKEINCSALASSIDDIEVLATGGTSLRYDTTAGQFIYNWQTPKLVGKCYQVTVTMQDGSSISALFKLK
jgi:hypothetical protein